MKKYILSLLLAFTSCFALAQVPQNSLVIGPKTNVNKALKFNRNSSTPPQIRWNESGSVVQFSNDGTNFFNIPSTAINLSVSTKTSNYTILSTDDVILGDASGGAFTLTLPTAVGNSGKVLYILKIDTVNNVNITGTIDGIANPSLTSVGQTYQIISNGTLWYSVNQKSRGVVSKTSNYTLAVNDELVLTDASGGSFTITLPSASSAKGRTYVIKRTDNTVANSVTLSGTVDGVVNPAMYTQNESYSIFSDGSSYRVISHPTSTDWTNAGNVTINATTTQPTKGTSTTTADNLYWRRVGRNAEVRMEYGHSTAGTATSGSGDYLFGMPTGLLIDTTKVTAYSTVIGGTTQIKNSNLVGTSLASSTASGLGWTGGVIVYDANFVRGAGTEAVFAGNNAATGAYGSGNVSFSGANVYFTFTFSVPITGWQP